MNLPEILHKISTDILEVKNFGPSEECFLVPLKNSPQLLVPPSETNLPEILHNNFGPSEECYPLLPVPLKELPLMLLNKKSKED
jgi:hypothetical protein